MSAAARVAQVLTSLPGRHQHTPAWAELHQVEPNEGGWFDVTSGRSGELYRVYAVDGSCTCPAGERRLPCSHVVAVRAFAERVLAEVTRRKLEAGRVTRRWRGRLRPRVLPCPGCQRPTMTRAAWQEGRTVIVRTAHKLADGSWCREGRPELHK